MPCNRKRALTPFYVVVANHVAAGGGDGVGLQARGDERFAAAFPDGKERREEVERAGASDDRVAFRERQRRSTRAQRAPGDGLAIGPAEQLRWGVVEHQRASGNRRRRTTHSPAKSRPIA